MNLGRPLLGMFESPNVLRSKLRKGVGGGAKDTKLTNQRQKQGRPYANEARDASIESRTVQIPDHVTRDAASGNEI